MYKIAVIPGDGIGKEVMEATLNVLNGLNINFKYEYGEAGDECLKKNGIALPEKTIKLIKETDACLFGAVGKTASDVIVKLRQELKLYANLRPIKSYPGTNALFDKLNIMIVRENTEGMYITSEEKYINDGAIAKRIITRNAEEKIINYAFQYAKNHNKTKVTGVHKANVLKKTDGLFKEVFYEVSKKYERYDIKSNDFYIDATSMYLITKGYDFQVIVTTNLFGDILSDEGAGLVGGLGLIPSANIGNNNALFEPVHGSAPDIAGKGLANPIAMLLSSKMMLSYLNENESALKIEKAILKVLSEGKHVTEDLGGFSSTMEMSNAIKSNLN